MANKLKTVYYCTSCGTRHEKMQGSCRGCGEWNTLVEEVVESSKLKINAPVVPRHSSIPLPLDQIESISESRIQTPDEELNRVLGGGIVEGSIVLIGGEPGIGKSTLLLQLALQLSPRKILYVSGEESESQIKMRADRLAVKNPGLLVVSETMLKKLNVQQDKGRAVWLL